VRGGASDAEEDPDAERQRLRQVGGGRRRVTESDPGLLKALQALLEASTRGDPQSPLLWTSQSTRHLAEALAQQGHHVSHHTVARLLEDLHYIDVQVCFRNLRSLLKCEIALFTVKPKKI